MTSLAACSFVAEQAPDAMVKAEREREIREQQSLGDSPCHGGLDHSQEGWISLPTSPAAFSRLSLAYAEAAVAICDASLARTGGRGSRAAADERRIPAVDVEAQARGLMAICLRNLGEERQRSLELLRQTVFLLRQVATGGMGALVIWLSTLGGVLNDDGMRELRAAEGASPRRNGGSQGVSTRGARADREIEKRASQAKGNLREISHLLNMSGQPHQSVEPAEAEELRLRLNGAPFEAERTLHSKWEGR